MSNSEWNKVDFQHFIDEFGYELIVNNAPTILYSKKDKEHEAYNSLIAFFFITGGLLIYISLSYIFEFIFNLGLIIGVSIIAEGLAKRLRQEKRKIALIPLDRQLGSDYVALVMRKDKKLLAYQKAFINIFLGSPIIKTFQNYKQK